MIVVQEIVEHSAQCNNENCHWSNDSKNARHLAWDHVRETGHEVAITYKYYIAKKG